METWSHLCSSDNTFYNLPLKQICSCGLGHQVQSLRYNGYRASPLIKRPKDTNLPLGQRIAALLLPKELPTKLDQNQHDYYDRQG
jgi:hypothetical protein